MKVNINGIVTEVTQKELDDYLAKFPEYKESYFIIKR